MPVLYRDDVTRVSIAQVRTRFPRRIWKTLSTVLLEHDGVACEVSLAMSEGTGATGGNAQRWLLCPRCRGRARVLGCVAGVGWSCPACGGWRSRGRRKLQ